MEFLLRQPVLDTKQRIIGYQIGWQDANGEAGAASDAEAVALLHYAAEQLCDVEGNWLLGDCLLFLPATPATLEDPVLRTLPPQRTVLCMGSAHLSVAETAAAATALRKAGYGIMLTDAEALARDKNLLVALSWVSFCASEAEFPAQARIYAALKQSSLHLAGRGIGTWKEFDSCLSLGMHAFVGKQYLQLRPGAPAGTLNPVQSMILQLMDMVRKNTDVRKLEEVLKRDAALSYKLLTYINSAGFGLGTEIQSLRHAVTMLGYSPLYRWLSVLLASAGTSAQSPALLQTAVVRGRFVELLGKNLLPKAEAENLFVAGMFSLLDCMLGLPMESVLENIPLSEQVNEALLNRQGIYGPFLNLAEACEAGNDLTATALADSLFINAAQVNEAHLASLLWAQNLKL